MGKKHYSMFGSLLLIVLIMSAATSANATAIAGTVRNTFSVFGIWFGSVNGEFVSNLTGIDVSLGSYSTTTTKTVVGNAAVDFTDTVTERGATIRGTAQADPDGYAIGNHSLNITLNFTNLSGIDYDFISFKTDFSAFNPGGPSIGAKVDNTNLEFARFSSSQSMGNGIGDSHFCDTRVPFFSYQLVPPSGAQCGVGSPDSSQGQLTIFDFDNGSTASRTFTLSLLLEVSSVPEPATIAIFGAGLALLGLQRRNRISADG